MEQNKTHPLVLAASAAVLISSALAAGVLTGVLPGMGSNAASRPAGSGESIAQAPVHDRGVSPVAQPPVRERSAPSSQAASRRVASASACTNCGVIESIHAVEVKGDASGVGAVAGGVTGAVVGSQFGRGGGRTAMTLLGAAGGALAGNAIEKSVKKSTVFKVTVRMDDGTRRELSQSAQPAFAVGEHVRVVNGSMLERA